MPCQCTLSVSFTPRSAAMHTTLHSRRNCWSSVVYRRLVNTCTYDLARCICVTQPIPTVSYGHCTNLNLGCRRCAMEHFLCALQLHLYELQLPTLSVVCKSCCAHSRTRHLGVGGGVRRSARGSIVTRLRSARGSIVTRLRRDHALHSHRFLDYPEKILQKLRTVQCFLFSRGGTNQISFGQQICEHPNGILPQLINPFEKFVFIYEKKEYSLDLNFSNDCVGCVGPAIRIALNC